MNNTWGVEAVGDDAHLLMPGMLIEIAADEPAVLSPNAHPESRRRRG
jgi:hypothetical protein